MKNSTEEDAANAMLIAAAPKMLAALAHAISEVEGFVARTGVRQFVPWIAEAQAAIREATGTK